MTRSDRHLPVGLIGAGIGIFARPAPHRRAADRTGPRYPYEPVGPGPLGAKSGGDPVARHHTDRCGAAELAAAASSPLLTGRAPDERRMLQDFAEPARCGS